VSWAVIISLAGLPNFPLQAVPGEEECSRAFGLTRGATPPEDLVDPATWEITCGSVAVPSSQIGHLLEIQAWAEGAREIYELDIAVLESEVETLQEEDSFQWIEPALLGGAFGIIVGIFLGGN